VAVILTFLLGVYALKNPSKKMRFFTYFKNNTTCILISVNYRH